MRTPLSRWGGFARMKLPGRILANRRIVVAPGPVATGLGVFLRCSLTSYASIYKMSMSVGLALF